MHCAVYTGKWHVVDYLLETDPLAQIEQANKVGMNPIDYAFQPEVRRHLELELLMAGADQDDKEDVSTDEEEAATAAMGALTLADSHSGEDSR